MQSLFLMNGLTNGALALALSCTIGALSACGPGILSPATPPPPLFHLEVETKSSLEVTGEVRGALAWSVYSDELVACMDELEVDGLIELELDDAGLPADLVAYELVQHMQSCLQFSERGHVETDSVGVQPRFPSSFTIPVAALPAEDVLTGHVGARLGIGDVLVYLDDSGDGSFSETPLGASAFVDRIVGTSIAWREDDVDESFLVWREGDLSSVWKFFRGIYGCPDPGEGFSTVTIRLLDLEPWVECVIDDAAIPVELDELALGTLACAADPDRHIPQQPSPNVGMPAGAQGECIQGGDGWNDVRYTVDAASVCPDFERYDLVGCSDLTSEEACRATSWDLVGDEPTWWPCSSSPQLNLRVTDHPSALTSGVDELFELTLSGGAFPSFSVEGLVVVIDAPGGNLVLAGEALTLTDADANGAWNIGDTLTVRELDGAAFDEDVVPGLYPLHVFAGSIEIVSAFGAPAWQPLPLPVIAPLEVAAVDAAATLTFGADEIARVTWTGVDRAGLALEDVLVRCYVGGEVPVAFGVAADVDAGTITLVDDADDDGLFSRGDTLLLAERENVAFALDPDGFATFGGLLFCSLDLDVGFNAFVNAASFTVGLDGTVLP